MFWSFPSNINFITIKFLITKVICVFYMLCGVIRLAYFNTLSITDETKKGKFIGVPITTVSIAYPIVFMIVRFINYSYLSIIMPIVLLILGISFILRIEIPKPNIVNVFKKVFNKYVINYMLFPIYIILISDLFYKLNNNTIIGSIKALLNTVTSYFMPFVFMVIIVDIILLILNSIFKKTKFPKIIIISLLTILLVISDIKLNIMGIPLELTDVNYLNPANMSMMGTATSSIGIWIIWVIIKAIITAGIGILFILIDKKRQVTIEKKNNRLIFALTGIILFSGLLLINFKNSNFILTKVYKTNNEEILNYNTVGEIYSEYGYWQGMYLNLLYKSNNKPEGYDKESTTKLLEEFTTEESKNNWGKANVVFILSEAFSYLENIDEIEFDKDLTPNINSYMNNENSKVFDLLVPSYGGSSVNTEFEILTGGTLSFWKSGFTPYTQYYNNYNGNKAPNIIKEFNNNGYETLYLTPWGETSYKSKYVYNLFGVDKTIYGADLNGEIKGLYYSDKSFMEDIYNELKDTSEGNYKFIMSATGQNHFPYNGEYENYDIKITNSSYSDEDNKILLNYAQGLYDADKELNNLYEKIQDLDVPTIIVFYGDHLPYTVNSEGNDLYTSSAYFHTEDEELNWLRLYTTKAVILANYDINIDDLEYINASYLGAYIINQMDLEISNYFKFINNARNVMPVFNRSSIYLDGKIYSYDNVSNEVKKILNNYKYVQYGSFYDYIN